MRICILCSQHLPDDVRVTHRLGKSFREAGFDVTWIGPGRQRTGDDYGIRFVFYPAAASRLGRLAHGARLLRAARRAGPQDVYFAVEPDSAEVAVRLARSGRCRAVFDIHEIYHQEMLMRWVPKPLLRPAGFLVRRRVSRVSRRCDLVVGAGQTRLDPYTDASTPRMVVRHCVPADFAPVRGPGPFSVEGRPLVVMHGKATMNHGTSEVLHALALLKSRYAIPCRVVMFNPRKDADSFRGTDVGRLAQSLGIAESIDLRDQIPFREMFSAMHACDVGLIAYRPAFGRRCMPNRVFEYMAAGIPVVGPAYAEELTRIVPRYECGQLCNTEDPEDLAQTLATLWRDKPRSRIMGLKGREAFERELTWERESQPLIDWLLSRAG